MAGGARWDVLSLLGMRKAEAVEEHGLRGASNARREGRSTCETGDAGNLQTLLFADCKVRS